MKKLLIGGVLSLLLVLGISVNEVILKPFPFLNVEYFTSTQWDFKPDGFERTPFPASPPKTVAEEISKAKRFDTVSQKVEWATNLTRAIMRDSKGEAIRSVDTVFDNDAKFQSICSESSKVFSSFMRQVDIPSRVVWMHGHTVSEIFDGNKWVLIDTYGNVRAFNKNSEPLGVREIVTDFDKVKFQKIIEDKNVLPAQYLDNGYLELKDNVYRKQNLLFTIKGSDLFDFHAKTRDVKKLSNVLLGIDPSGVGEARQYVINDYFVGNYGLGLVKRFNDSAAQ